MGKDRNPLTMVGSYLETTGIELATRLGGNGVFVHALSQLVRPENVWAYDELAATLAQLTNIFKVMVGGQRTAAEVLEASGYTSYSSIIERYALAHGPEHAAMIELFGTEHFDRDPNDAQIRAEYARRGLTRPAPSHAIHFGEQYNRLPVDGHHVIFFLEYPHDGTLRLSRMGTSRAIVWEKLDPCRDWKRRSCLFAGVRE